MSYANREGPDECAYAQSDLCLLCPSIYSTVLSIEYVRGWGGVGVGGL